MDSMPRLVVPRLVNAVVLDHPFDAGVRFSLWAATLDEACQFSGGRVLPAAGAVGGCCVNGSRCSRIRLAGRTDRGVQADLVEPPHPVQGGELDLVDVAPRAVEVDALGFVEPDGRLGERVNRNTSPPVRRRVVAGVVGSDRGSRSR